MPHVWRRLEFAGGDDGEWRIRVYEPQQCADGATMVLWWDSEMPHDLVRLPSAEALASCNFSAAETLAPEGLTGEHHLPCVGGEIYHLACSVAGHCEAGQRLSVVGSVDVAALDDAGEPLLHVASMARVMTGLLGFEASEAQGHARLTRGFATEAVASSSLELLWCLSRWRAPPALSEDGAPSASLDHLKAQAAPTQPGAPAWVLAVAPAARIRPPQS